MVLVVIVVFTVAIIVIIVVVYVSFVKFNTFPRIRSGFFWCQVRGRRRVGRLGVGVGGWVLGWMYVRLGKERGGLAISVWR